MVVSISIYDVIVKDVPDYVFDDTDCKKLQVPPESKSSPSSLNRELTGGRSTRRTETEDIHPLSIFQATEF